MCFFNYSQRMVSFLPDSDVLAENDDRLHLSIVYRNSDANDRENGILLQGKQWPSSGLGKQ